MGKYAAVLSSYSRDPVIGAMFESEKEQQRAQQIILLLAKLYVLLELSLDTCPVCHKALTHDDECPISLAWTLLTPEQQHDARTAIRALALSIGNDESLSDSLSDPLVH